jgi:hypothetical protein
LLDALEAASKVPAVFCCLVRRLKAPGFFTPRLMAPWFVPAGGAGATSYYEHYPAFLWRVLERFFALFR